MTSGELTMPRATEWLRDNYYLIRRVARQVEVNLPGRFIRHLRALASGSAAGRLRIDIVARELIAQTNMDFDLAALRSFVEAYQVEAYQQVTPPHDRRVVGAADAAADLHPGPPRAVSRRAARRDSRP